MLHYLITPALLHHRRTLPLTDSAGAGEQPELHTVATKPRQAESRNEEESSSTLKGGQRFLPPDWRYDHLTGGVVRCCAFG